MKKLDLGKDNINRLLLSFAVPCVISMLINSIYNIVDQIFIGKGVGTVGNAATNVIFPLVLIFGAIASLIGNGASANLSLKLGEGKKEEASNTLGSSITITFFIAFVVGIVSYLTLPVLIPFFGSTESVYSYALDYGKIISIGAPFVIVYTALSNLIRADGSPKYAMILLVVGAIINLILDPIFIFGFSMGVKGGAIATVMGQIVSFGMAILYIPKMKSISLTKKDFIPNRSIFRVLGLGLSSFITQMTVLVLFVFMNNMLTKLGVDSKFGAEVPLSVYGIISKVNSLYIATILGIAIGAQPIIGFNYGAENRDRVKETLKKVLIINFLVGIFFNFMFVFFPRILVSAFISPHDANYELFMEFAILTSRSFMLLIAFNALEITTSIVIQSLGHVLKATMVSFTRQIILFIPIACFLSIGLHKGIYGVLYAGPIADAFCFLFCIFIFATEIHNLSKEPYDENQTIEKESDFHYQGKHIVITISREYGSGGRFVGKLLALKLGVPFYDKELISYSAKESGLSESYIKKIDEQNKNAKFIHNNDDLLFVAEQKVIQNLSKKSCVIVGRCADYILKDEPHVFKIFLYSDNESKINRAIKYYGLNSKNALLKMKKIDKKREKHYEYYTNREWKNWNNYDLLINVDKLGVYKTRDQIIEYIKNI